MAGTVIAAALVTGINSDLPGQVIASVTRPVFDTASGRHLLIPQGSRLTGRFNSQVAFGQAGSRSAPDGVPTEWVDPTFRVDAVL